MTKLFINYQKRLDELGPPYGGEPLPSEVIDAYKGRLPDTFLDFWRVCGLGKWLKGYFQFCNPENYKPILRSVFEGDRDFDPEITHALGFSAFGEILAWNEQYRVVKIDTLNNSVSCGALFKPKPDISLDISLGVGIGNVNATSYDLSDQSGKPMFKRLLKACGELEFGQIYAPKLHPSLGGPLTVENLRPVDALVAMSIAAQSQAFTLYNTTIPSVPAVRFIGN